MAAILGKQQMMGATFIDLKKAFDLVDHDCLLHKVEHYGIRGQSLDWFQNYLTNRTQKVSYANEISTSLILDFGIPQGSVLGPLLFVLYMNDLPDCLRNCSINMYADDTIIFYTGPNTNEIKRILQEDLNRVAQWMENSRLVLNERKTKLMLFGTKPRLNNVSGFNVQINCHEIERVPEFNYLGVMRDENLTWKEHTEVVCNKVAKRLGLLSRIRPWWTLEASKSVYNSLVLPVFDYVDVILSELSVGCCQDLQRLQNRAARIILQQHSSENMVTCLNWVDLATRRSMHKCILVFKCLNNPYI